MAVTVGSIAGDAVLTVKDSGIGISPELLPHVFEVFVQGATSLDRAPGGLGIGLALVNQMVSLHGGTISAESAGAGRGSTFVIRLARIATPVALPVATLPAGAGRRRWRILLIEDNDDARPMTGDKSPSAICSNFTPWEHFIWYATVRLHSALTTTTF